MEEVRSEWGCDIDLVIARSRRRRGNPASGLLRFARNDGGAVVGRLAGKIAIVTGAASGIGKASVELFRREGATVVGADLHGTDFECDAGDEEQVQALVAHTVRDHGGLDIFFANAGISGGFEGIFD